MSRSIRIIFLLGVAAFLCSLLCGVVLFVVSSGDPVEFVQTALIRASLASRQDELDRPIGTDDSPRRFTITAGDTPRIVAQNLFQDGLILDPELFVDYVRIEGIDVQLEAGTYFLNQTQSTADIAYALTDSRNSQFPFRILEGWRLEEVAAIIDTNPYFGFSGDEFLAVVGPGTMQGTPFAEQVGLPINASLEGFLFPDTYQLPAEVTPTMLRDILTGQFVEQVGADLIAEAGRQGLSMHNIVTLASIIQREAIHSDEHPLIASVYRNRLSIDMKLDADPTVQYAIGQRNGDWWADITQADYVNVISPYNTYLNTGLPPGPIANPGISAIRAAVEPQESPYYFFRTTCTQDGYHNFAETYEEHLANGC